MANWRRGFFRLWVIVAALWLILVGAIAVPAYLNPALPSAYFTINDDGSLETLEPFGRRNLELLAEADKGFYQKVSFKDGAKEVTLLAPNKVQVAIGGRTYQALVSAADLEPSGRANLVSTLVSYISAQEAARQDLVVLRSEIVAALPTPVRPIWVTRENGERVKQYAANLHSEAIASTQQAQITYLLLYGLLPPLILLIIGGAVGWALTGFRRDRVA